MKSSASFLPWLAVPVAAVAGFYGSREWHGAGSFSAKTPGVPAAGPLSGNESVRQKSPGPAAAWAERLAGCGAGELPGVYQEIQALPETEAGQKRLALRLLCARWADVDAPGGVAFFTKILEETRDPQGRHWMFTEWALLDPAAACGAILLLLPEKEARDELDKVGAELLHTDREKFWTWFQKARRPMAGNMTETALWMPVVAAHWEELSVIAGELAVDEKLAKADPRTFYQAKRLYRLLTAHLAEGDMDKAIAWAQALPEAVRGNALYGALEAMGEKTPEKLADSILRVGGAAFRSAGGWGILREAVKGMTDRDPVKTVEWLDRNAGKLGQEVYGPRDVMAQGLSRAVSEGKITPQEAFSAVSAVKGESGQYLVRFIWRDMPPDKLAPMAGWLNAQPSGDVRNSALKGVIPVWAEQDQAAAMRFVSELKDPALASALYSSLAGGAYNGGYGTWEKVAATLQAMPPDSRAQFLANQKMLPSDDGFGPDTQVFQGPLMAAALEGLPPGENTGKAVANVAEGWASAEPLAALAWASGQADAGLREKATGAAVEAWAREDAWSASQWIDALPAGGERDIAAHHLARVLRTDEPESAWTWAGNISDPAIRQEAQTAVLRKWRDSSAPDARAAVDRLAADLPAAERRKLTDTLEHRDEAK